MIFIFIALFLIDLIWMGFVVLLWWEYEKIKPPVPVTSQETDES